MDLNHPHVSCVVIRTLNLCVTEDSRNHHYRRRAALQCSLPAASRRCLSLLPSPPQRQRCRGQRCRGFCRRLAAPRPDTRHRNGQGLAADGGVPGGREPVPGKGPPWTAVGSSEWSALGTSRESADVPLIRREEEDALHRALDSLGEDRSGALAPVSWDGLSHREIGASPGLKEDTVSKRISRAQARLRVRFDLLYPGSPSPQRSETPT